MNTSRLRSRRILIPAVATIAVLGVGGGVWAATADDEVEGGERDRIAAAATDAVGGTAVEVESSDDPGEAYEVEVRLEDGSEVEVTLDQDLAVVAQEADDQEGDDATDDDTDGDREDADDDTRDEDHVELTGDERTAVEEAALAAVGGGTVVKVERGDDPGEAYEVELLDENDTEWDVELDADHQVIRKAQDS